jgi:hypothetical protein
MLHIAAGVFAGIIAAVAFMAWLASRPDPLPAAPRLPPRPDRGLWFLYLVLALVVAAAIAGCVR